MSFFAPGEEPALTRIRSKLEQLRRTDSDLSVFGASEHQYTLAPPKTSSELVALENRCGIKLPDDYRSFLLTVGDGINSDAECGGAGPGYGLYSVDTLDEVADKLATPFPLNASILNVVELDESQPQWKVWKKAFDVSSCGTLPLAHYGCGIFASLVLKGPARGTVWIIDGACGDLAHFADHSRFHSCGGGANLHNNANTVDGPHSFVAWYEDWLDGSLTPTTGSRDDPQYLPGAFLTPVKPYEPPAVAPCPECGQPLRTSKARQCFECGANWHEK